MDQVTANRQADTGLIGHARAWALLDRLVARERLPAAVLLSGPPNVGKRTLANHLAARLLDSPDPLRVGEHADALDLQAGEALAARAQVAHLLQQVWQRPIRARYRCVFLEHVDRVSPPAAALLLKAVEDAPSFAKFFLTATVDELVAPTIRSRSLQVPLSPAADQVVASGLITRGVAAGDAERIATLAGGRPGLAIRLAADDALRARYEHWHGVVQKPARVADLALDDPTLAEEFLVFLQGALRATAVSMPVSPGRLRRAREGVAMLRHHVPPALVIEFVLGTTA